ncbi:hypothetical protein CJZ71_14045 [Bacillus subtilis]|nr:hypothetical protein BSR08_20265 [Bacillus subtilis]AYK69270.1 hypothetical protein D9C09_05580 [Bacillus subtilis subsp. subtilis]MDR4255638.1 hypothetical protein [Bacillus subtilis subsp. subtilis NCIB 3610 = ATCC 6051 = DSM 10]MDR4280585.1 hypothetical protein [Bacillus subtilis KCTC 1028 = ATCC 6051a]QDW04015.1 hypothetical protein FFE90_001865 [Bacillus sp. KBS0812]
MARLAFIFGEILLRNEIIYSLYAYLANIYIDTGFTGQAYSALCCSHFCLNDIHCTTFLQVF